MGASTWLCRIVHWLHDDGTGTTETVRIESAPTAAGVRIEKDGVLVAECRATPCDFVLKRKSPPFTATIEKGRCDTATALLDQDHDTSKDLTGNLIGLGGLTGLAVDGVSGAYSCTQSLLS